MSPDIEKRLAHCRNLPTFSAVALRLVALARQPDLDLGTLAAVLGQDPGLAAKVMRISNSALYASQRRVENLRQAVTVLGLNATVNLALGCAMGSALARHFSQNEVCAMVWRRSVMAATVARALGSLTGIGRGEELMLAALLQDIGTLALCELEADTYPSLLVEKVHAMHQLPERERELYGVDHAQLGAALARQWRFPGYMVDAIATSESPVQESPFATCTALSGPLADLWLHALPPPARPRLEIELARRLDINPSQFTELALRVADAVPEIAAMYETRLLDNDELDALLEQATELRELRTLIAVQEALRHKRESEAVRDRAAELEQKARRDPLTGLFNRSHFGDLLAKEFSAAREHGWPLALAFIDIDQFKQVNERFGHHAGDEILARFATVMSRNLRDSDVVCRYSGEEFLVLLPGTDNRSAAALMQRLIASTAATPISEIEGELVRVTASVGLAALERAEDYPSPQAMIAASDRALYQAKGGGRSRLSIADPLTPQHGAD